jgi:hypothetical protein
MKRLLVLAVVGLLVVSAGCGMTSQAADEARENQNTPTTTTQTTSNPHDTAPIGAMLPEGYSMEGIENVSLAYQQHRESLHNGSFHITYLQNTSDADGTLSVITNGSAAEERWHMRIGTRNGPTTKAIYQTGSTQYVNTFDGSKSVTTSETPFAVPDGTLENQTVREMLTDIEVYSPQAMSQGNETFIFYKVESYDGAAVEGGHFVIFPSGQIRIIYLKYDNSEIAYTTTMNDAVDVTQPSWVDS